MKDLGLGNTVKTTCAYCGVGCGVLATISPAGEVTVKGDPEHPANYGRLCSKGSALADTLSSIGRLVSPEIGGVKTDWDTALELVAKRFQKTIAEHGPDSVAFYVSGQLLTEDYYVANKLMKGFIGSANIDTNSRLCMASSVAGHRRAFGTDTVPGNYEDLEQADLVVLTGSNLAWCHPVIYQRLLAAKTTNPAMKVVNIDPRRTATSDIADLHLQIEVGADVTLFNRLLLAIVDSGHVDHDYVAAHVNGFDAAVEAARNEARADLGISDADLQAFIDLWTGTEKVVTVYSQGVNQSSSGSDKVNAIINCHLATGRIGHAGMGPFSVTGQPNAMGGREVGGLANMLACHLDLENADHREAVQDFWHAPAMPDQAGLKAVEMFDAVADGRIKAIWIMCTNPVVSMPEADKVRTALEDCDFVVVSDMYGDTDTALTADVLLPATGWSEKDGTVTNSDRTISRQRRFLAPVGQAKHDWDIISEVGRRMGWERAFAYTAPEDIFREYAALSSLGGKFGKDFDISAWDIGYDCMTPTRWGKERYFGNGGFYHADGRAKMLPVQYTAPKSAPTDAFPLRMNSGRVRDHWHTMTRTGQAARLSQHLAEPFIEIHPATAERLGIKPAHLVEVTSPHGKAIVRALITDRVRRREVFVPIHWTGQYSSAGRVDALVTGYTDPVSGQPESKATCVDAQPFAADFYAFAVSTAEPQPDCAYWAKARVDAGWRMELAGAKPADWEAFAISLFGKGDVTSVIDDARGIARIAVTRNGKLLGALFAGPEPVAVSRSHLASLLGEAPDAVLAGRPGADQPDAGPIICSCFSVGVNTILTAMEKDGLMTVEAIGKALSAGTNCGSCKPEIAQLIARTAIREAAE
ncbi:molybdopterin-dependent oxidoreductase [Marivivens donghaensis]|uniref:Molybdopterin-dependent oxidoreductase n=1 Tax=Marivivens donghaensis TaxID=1699413 RepID=A0ABX0W3I6_9RHOB|nr:nitrate reductase [Marivivens donghaensis]NIY73497.1 molybdopterin-dependent oxidoreductase [Marivivens donghaensis]